MKTFTRKLIIAAGVLAAGVLSVNRQTQAATDVWDNTGSAWETGSDWNTGNVPTAADIASFDPTVANPLGVIFNPTINSADAAQTLNLNNNYLGGTYSFSGAGSLTIGTGGITTRGFGTQTISGPALAGAAAGNLSFNIGTDSGLTLAGTTTATTNTGAVTLNGGTLTVDNSTSTVAKLSGNAVAIDGGGLLAYVGNATATTLALGTLTTTNNGLGGNNVIRVTPNGASAILSFTGTSVAGSLRAGTRTTLDFQAGSGNLGDKNGAQITFGTVPFLSAGGLFANTSGGATVGFATVTDASGKNFATYANTADTVNGVVSVGNTSQTRVTVVTATTAAQLQAAATTSATQFNAPTGTTTLAATASPATLRISPAAGATLDTLTFALGSQGIMLDGANNFSIQSSAATPGALGTAGTHYFYVNNAATTLSTNLQVTSSTNAVNFVGPGFVSLTGTTLQNNGTAGNNYRFTIEGGVLRGNTTQLDLSSAATHGTIDLFGGVLEITNGTNGTGTGADFSRALGTSAGQVVWTGTAGQDQGSGGFSAFGAAASVNIGGASGQLNWASTTGFVADGYALRFGSTQSNAVLTFQNPIGLDAGTAGTYAAREINVTLGSTTVINGTVLSGVVSGTNTSDLLKTGNGSLTLTAANTYAGRTIVEGGTLVAASTAGRALNGTAGVIINSGGTVQMGAANQFNATTPAPLTLNGTAANAATFSVNGNSQGSTAANGVGALTLASTSSNNVLDFNSKNGVVTFASFAPNGAALTINNYLNNNGTSGGPDQLISIRTRQTI